MKEKEPIEEFSILPYRYEVDLDSIDLVNHKKKFTEELHKIINFKDKQTVWIYPEIERNKLYLKAISTNTKGEEITIIGLQTALNKLGRKRKSKEA